MRTYKNMVDEVIDKADIILMLLDARKIKESIHPELEERIREKKKKFLYVINKCDLISKEEQNKIKFRSSIQISAKEHWSTLRLLRKIKELAGGKKVTVGVVGYPNTGKSSLINALKGRKSAPVSQESGYTKGLMKVKITENVLLIDTPGVFSEKKDFIPDYILIGAKNPEKIKNPEEAAVDLIVGLDGLVEKFYGVRISKDPYQTLEKIALKGNYLKKGGLLDTTRASKEIIRKWQRGEIKSGL